MMLNPKDFRFKFEMKGGSPIFMDLYVSNYAPGGYMLLHKNRIIRSYISFEAVEKVKLASRKLFLTTKNITKAISRLESLFGKLRTEIDRYSVVKKVSKKDFLKVFKIAEDIHKEYRLFDTTYTEYLYQTRSDVASLIEQHKNKIREQYNSFFVVYTGGFVDFLKIVAQQVGVKLKDICWCLKSEILGLLEGKKISLKDIEARHKSFVFIKNKKGAIQFLQSPQTNPLIKSFKVSSKKGVRVIKGQAAFHSPHNIRGKVIIINSDYIKPHTVQAKIAAMKKGSILVSITTAPDLLPAMKKAGAIVTDVGGMLSHAAIVARELKIPCIVNTGLATKTFKDGDTVEVDTNAGIIKIV